MRRREFIGGIASAAATYPLLASAQQVPVIGFLYPTAPEGVEEYLAAGHLGLSDQGYAEGRNVAIEYRWANGLYDRLPELAYNLVSRKVAVLYAGGGTPTALAAAAATTTIPIVFSVGADPVSAGLVTSYAPDARNELPPFHSITSSARASRLSGNDSRKAKTLQLSTAPRRVILSTCQLWRPTS